MLDSKVDTQSQNDFRGGKQQSQNNTVDSGQPTAVSGGATKHDMSGSGTDLNQKDHAPMNLSQSDFGAAHSRKHFSTIPKTLVQLSNDGQSQDSSRHKSRLSIKKQNTTSEMVSHGPYLNTDNKFELTLHQVKIQISSRIDLQVFCQCNDSDPHFSAVCRVDQTERVANFNDQKIVIDLSKVRGRTA